MEEELSGVVAGSRPLSVFTLEPPKRDPPAGVLGRIAEDKYFETATLLVIVVNAWWMFVDVEWNHVTLMVNGKLPLEPVSTVVENCFCCYFSLEIFIRFFGAKTWCSCCKDLWFLFDLTLVILMVLETWVLPLVALATGGGPDISGLSSLRLLRLLRLTRMVRFMRFFPELLTLVRGMARAMQSVAWVLLFLLIVTYIFAIVFTSQLGTPNYQRPPELVDAEDPLAPELFSDMFASMMSLFTHGILGDNLHFFLITLREESVALMWLAIVFLVLCGISLLNMLIGILCQVIADSSEEEEKEREQADLDTLLRRLFEAADRDGDGRIAEEEWARVASSSRCLQLLARLQVDARKPVAERLSELQATIFRGAAADDDDEDTNAEADRNKVYLDFDQFRSQVLDLRKDAEIGHFDLRRLEIKVAEKDRLLKTRLAKLQADLRHVLDVPADAPIPAPSAGSEAAGKLVLEDVEAEDQELLAPPLPQRPSTPAMPAGTQPVLPGQLEVVDFDEVPEANPEPPPAAGSATSGKDWIREVPTALLIDTLQSRATNSWRL